MSTTDKIIEKINALNDKNAQLENDLSGFEVGDPVYIVLQKRILENQRAIAALIEQENILLGNISLDIYIHIYIYLLI